MEISTPQEHILQKVILCTYFTIVILPEKSMSFVRPLKICLEPFFAIRSNVNNGINKHCEIFSDRTVLRYIYINMTNSVHYSTHYLTRPILP